MSAYIDLVSMLGYTNNAKMMMETFHSSSNIILTDNPPYDLEMFAKAFPKFIVEGDGKEAPEGEEPIPAYVFNLFVGMAQASIKKDRYKSNWEYLMGLYIAHNLALFIRTSQGDPSASSALASSLPFGIAASKSVDGLSISYEFMGLTEDFAGYGTWKLTLYGQQLITLTKIYGRAGMWVNG
jgi:hypothetical protein|nr:MAG TPA: head to tail adaptor [Caudoviricetes sp.]